MTNKIPRIAKAVLLWLLVCGGAFCATAQSTEHPIYSLGETPADPATLERWPLAPLTRAYIPEAIDLSAHFPPPGDQKKIGACVAWATGYAARSYYALLESGSSDNDKDRIVSPAHLHNLMTASPEHGSCLKPSVNIATALTILQQQDLQSVARYPETNICAASLPYEGAIYGSRIKGAQRVAYGAPVRGTGENRSGIERNSLDRMRIKLSAGHPILLGLLVGERLMRLKAGEIYSGSIHETGEIGREETGWHAVVLTGYDDRRSAFRLLNSWGSQWADGGYGWISYDTVIADSRYAFVMEPFVQPRRPAPTRPTGRPSDLNAGLNLECSELSQEQGPNRKPTVSGFVSRQAYKLALEQYAREHSVDSEVQLRPWPVCEALLTLREPLQAASRPKITLTGGDRPLRAGETFSIEVRPPNVPAFLYVFYLEDGGTVVNLSPRTALIRAQTPPGVPLIFGDGRNGRQTFRVTPPRSVSPDGRELSRDDPERGHEAIIAVAARAPIKELEDLEEPGNRNYRASAASQQKAPGDRILLSVLKDIVFKREGPEMLPREVSADVLHLRILD